MKTIGKWLLVVVTLGCLTTPVLASSKGSLGRDGQGTAFATTDHRQHADTTMPDNPSPDGDDNPDGTGGGGNDGGPDSTDDGGGCGGSGGGGNDSGPDGTGGTDF